MVVGVIKTKHVMILVKYKQAPVMSTSPVDRLASEIFGQNISRFFGSDGFLDHAPRVNIIENNDEFRVEMQVPGFDKKDLKVEMVDDTLTIRGEHTVEDQNEEVRWTRREFSRTSFERSFVLPSMPTPISAEQMLLMRHGQLVDGAWWVGGSQPVSARQDQRMLVPVSLDVETR